MADIDPAVDIPAVESTTEATPHPADEDSAAGPYTDLSPDRPPVSTTSATTPIAHSLVAGAGAEHTEGQVTPGDHEDDEDEAAPKRGPGRPRKTEDEG